MIRRRRIHWLLRLAAVAGALALLNCRPTPPAPAPTQVTSPGPEVPRFSVWRPFFFTSHGDHDISYPPASGFAIRVEADGPPYLITALHILSPESGLAAAVAPESLSESIRQLVVSEAFGASDSTHPLKPPLDLDPALADSDYWTKTDAVFIPLAGTLPKVRPFEIGDVPLRVGDTVWLSTAVYAGASPSQTTHRAEVTAVTEDGRIEYRFENPRLSFQAADGAPLIDDSGKLIGMHQRATMGEDNQPATGQGVTATRLLEALGKLL